MSVGILLKLGSYNSSRCTYFILHCAYLVRASLNSLYIHLSVLPEVEMSVTGEWAPLSCKHHTYNRENELSAAALNRTFTVLELLKTKLNNIFFDGSHLRQWAETKIFQHCTKRQHRKKLYYLKHLSYNYRHSHKWRVEWIPSSTNSSFELLHIVVFLSTRGAHQKLNPVFIRATNEAFLIKHWKHFLGSPEYL